MLGIMTTTEAKWGARVRDWRASGKTAEAFSSGQAFEPSTLRYWASRLKTAGATPTTLPTGGAGPKAIAMARVVRRRRSPAPGARGAETSEIAIAIGEARITVSRGFDPELLRHVVAALGADR